MSTSASNSTTKVKHADVWSKVVIPDDHLSIRFHGKVGATWAQMNEWLEDNYGQHGEDPHWTWRGFGTCGTEDYEVILVRKACDPYLCDCGKKKKARKQ